MLHFFIRLLDVSDSAAGQISSQAVAAELVHGFSMDFDGFLMLLFGLISAEKREP